MRSDIWDEVLLMTYWKLILERTFLKSSSWRGYREVMVFAFGKMQNKQLFFLEETVLTHLFKITLCLMYKTALGEKVTCQKYSMSEILSCPFFI